MFSLVYMSLVLIGEVFHFLQLLGREDKGGQPCMMLIAVKVSTQGNRNTEGYRVQCLDSP